jgi:hypothetical protein
VKLNPVRFHIQQNVGFELGEVSGNLVSGADMAIYVSSIVGRPKSEARQNRSGLPSWRSFPAASNRRPVGSGAMGVWARHKRFAQKVAQRNPHGPWPAGHGNDDGG